MTVTHALALLAVIGGACGVATLTRAKGVATPVLLVLAGLAVSAIPGMPVFRLNPQFVLIAVLPPLVYTSALESSHLSLRDSVRTLTLLSACDEDSCRILSQLIRSGRSPVAGGRLVVR